MYRMRITKRGIALLAKLAAGQAEMSFTKIALGEGMYAWPAQGYHEITKLAAHCFDEQITDIDIRDDFIAVSCQITNSSYHRDFVLVEAGLYAQDPNEGEILFAYHELGNDSEVFSADQQTGSKSIAFTFMVSINPHYFLNAEINLPGLVSVGGYQKAVKNKIEQNQKGKAGGVAKLDHNGIILEHQIPDRNREDFSGIYGVEVDYETGEIIRIADAVDLNPGFDFDHLEPWQRRRCMVADNGIVLAYYGDEYFSDDGVLWAEIEKDEVTYYQGTQCQVMVEQPAFWTKVVPLKTKVSSTGRRQLKKVRYYISPDPKPGFKINEAFKDKNGILKDKIYLAAYEGVLSHMGERIGEVNDNVYQHYYLESVAWQRPTIGEHSRFSREMARHTAVNRSEGWQLHNIFALAATQLLALVEYAAFDLQNVIGRGILGSYWYNFQREQTGETFYLGNESGVGYMEAVTYRGEENLWGNISTWLDGANFVHDNTTRIYLKGYGHLTDHITDGYEIFDTPMADQSGYIKAFGYSEKYDYLFIPAAVEQDSSQTITGDHYDYQEADPGGANSSGIILGTNDNGGGQYGLWSLNARGNDHQWVGARLMFVPPDDNQI